MGRVIVGGMVLGWLLAGLVGCGTAGEDSTLFNPGSESVGSEGTAGGTPASEVPADSGLDETSTTERISSKIISDFLWKPESERSGTLVVLVNPTNLVCRVTGAVSETLTNTGPSNGRGSTLRGSFSGCRYGDGVHLEFFDSAGRRVLTASGGRSIKVARGCDRSEWKG